MTYADDKSQLKTTILDNYVVGEDGSGRFYYKILLTNEEKYAKVFYSNYSDKDVTLEVYYNGKIVKSINIPKKSSNGITFSKRGLFKRLYEVGVYSMNENGGTNKLNGIISLKRSSEKFN